MGESLLLVRRTDSDASAGNRARRNALAKTVRELLVRSLRAERVPDDAAEDLAHDLALQLVQRIEQGLVADESVAAYVRRAAVNRARDYYRQRSGVFERARHGDDVADDLAGPDDDAEEQLVRLEEEREARARLDAVRAVLETAPVRYRDVLSAVYLEGKPIEELVRLELQRRCVSELEHDARAIKRARAAVDKVLERARNWVRARFLAPARASERGRSHVCSP